MSRIDLLAPWSGLHGGAPPFVGVDSEDFEPALIAAMERKRAEVAAIAANPDAPDFQNTIAALEGAGRALRRVLAVYRVHTSTLNDAAMQSVEAKMAPRLAALADEIIQNAALFARIEAVHAGRETAGLTTEQRRLVEVIHRRFARQGAGLAAPSKTRLAALNQRLAALYTAFSQNELADEEGRSLILTAPEDLAGLPDGLIQSAAEAARQAGLEGRWLIANTRSSMEPFLTWSSRRDLREAGFLLWTRRGDNDDGNDNNAVIAEILALRAEKAALLGKATYAHWAIADQMAASPEAALALLIKVWEPAKARVAKEVADMQSIAEAEAPGANTPFEAWDYRYYAEKVRKARYDVDDAAVRPYLQLDRLCEGMFWVAGRLFGLDFQEVDDLPVYHPDVRTFRVSRAGQPVGLFYLDPYARAGKKSGAWMSEYRTQERFAGEVTPVVSNNANFVKPPAGEPTLLSWSDAVTLFHEFGHGLHGLCSNAAYPSLAGTSVVRDFVELPSQIMERWLPTEELLSRFAVHHRTGKPMPRDLIARIKSAHAFNKGFDTVEYLASAIVDLKAHLAAPPPVDPRAFEVAALGEIGMPREIVMRHRLPHFGHLFSGDGYASGYYVYIWADVLTADAAEAFAQAPGGFYDETAARRLLDEILSAGDTVEAGEAFRRFRGRDATIDALMRDRGFPASAAV